MTFDPIRWKNDTPAARAGRIHMNNAGAALMPRPVIDAIQAHLQREVEMGGYEAADAAEEEIEASYDGIARLIGAARSGIAVVENATVAFAQALSAFDFAPGDVLVTSRNDYISNQLMYLSLAQRQGVRVVRAQDAPDGGIDPQSLREILRTQTVRLVALTWVPTNSGLVQPAAEVGALCAQHGVPFLLDACQAVGQIPVDVRTLHCDFLSATARKFLRGPRGVGFLYVSDDMLRAGSHPLYIDMRGADWVDDDRYELRADARRFENWEFAYALHIGMGAAARYALDVGIEDAGRHAAALAGRLRGALAELPGVRVLDRGPELCAIVTIEIDGVDAPAVVARLREQAINTSATFRAWAVLDMKDKGARSAVRISPHYYNTEREADIVVDAVSEFAAD